MAVVLGDVPRDLSRDGSLLFVVVVHDSVVAGGLYIQVGVVVERMKADLI